MRKNVMDDPSGANAKECGADKVSGGSLNSRFVVNLLGFSAVGMVTSLRPDGGKRVTSEIFTAAFDDPNIIFYANASIG